MIETSSTLSVQHNISQNSNVSPSQVLDSLQPTEILFDNDVGEVLSLSAVNISNYSSDIVYFPFYFSL